MVVEDDMWCGSVHRYIDIYIYIPLGKRYKGDNGKGNMWINIKRRGTWEGVWVA